MMLWKKATELLITKWLRMAYGSKIQIVAQNGTVTEIDLAELAALNSIGAADLAKIDGITDGTGAASKALVLDAGGNVAMPSSGIVGLSRASVAAAGSTAADATVLVEQVNVVTAADSAKGVALPAAAVAEGPIWVINSVTSEELKVYPVNGGNDNINSLAEDAAFILAPGAAAFFVPTSATQWYAEEVVGIPMQKLAVEAGAGITGGAGTVYRSSVQRNGGVIKTQILIDLTGLSSSTTDLDIIGQGVSAAHIGQITAARNGTILTGRMTCLEVPVGGADDIDLYAATEGTGIFDGGIAALVETAIITSGAAWTLALTKAIGADILADKFLYLVGGEAGTAAPYTAGKFLIELEGYDA